MSLYKFCCGKERFFPSAVLRAGSAGVASLSFDYAQDMLLRNLSVSHRPNCAAGAVEVLRTTNEIDLPYLPGTVGILVLLGNLAKDARHHQSWGRLGGAGAGRLHQQASCLRLATMPCYEETCQFLID